MNYLKGFQRLFTPKVQKTVGWSNNGAVSSIPADVYRAIARAGHSSAVAKLSGCGNQFYSSCYELCPTLQAIIQKKSEGLVNGKIISIDPVTEKAKPSDAFNKAMKVLNNPNRQMNRNNLLMYIDACLNVYGVAYVYQVVSEGFSAVTGLIPIPNNAVSVTYKSYINVLDPEQFDNIIDTYSINIMGMPLILRGEDTKRIKEIRASSINLHQGYEYRPSSRLDSLKMPITNIVASIESRNQIIVKRGAEGILSPKMGQDQTGVQLSLDPTVKQAIQDDYAKYGYLDTQWHTILTEVPLEYTPITRNVAQLGLFEGENTDKRTIALSFNMPAPLIGLPDEAKYNTFAEAQRQMYEGAVIPDAGIISQAFDEVFKADGWKFYFDFSHLDCFQKSETERATALDKTITALTNGVNAGFIKPEEAQRIVNDFIN
jgi:hypothetical protein